MSPESKQANKDQKANTAVDPVGTPAIPNMLLASCRWGSEKDVASLPDAVRHPTLVIGADLVYAIFSSFDPARVLFLKAGFGLGSE